MGGWRVVKMRSEVVNPIPSLRPPQTVKNVFESRVKEEKSG